MYQITRYKTDIRIYRTGRILILIIRSLFAEIGKLSLASIERIDPVHCIEHSRVTRFSKKRHLTDRSTTVNETQYTQNLRETNTQLSIKKKTDTPRARHPPGQLTSLSFAKLDRSSGSVLQVVLPYATSTVKRENESGSSDLAEVGDRAGMFHSVETGDSSRLTVATVCQEARLHDTGAARRGAARDASFTTRACAAGRVARVGRTAVLK